MVLKYTAHSSVDIYSMLLTLHSLDVYSLGRPIYVFRPCDLGHLAVMLSPTSSKFIWYVPVPLGEL